MPPMTDTLQPRSRFPAARGDRPAATVHDRLQHAGADVRGQPVGVGLRRRDLDATGREVDASGAGVSAVKDRR